MKYECLMGFLIISMISSCSITENIAIDGEYFMVDDDSKILTIKDSTIVFHGTTSSSDAENIILYTDEKGNIAEAPNCKKVKYSIDSIDSNNGMYVSAYKGKYRCYGYHLIKENQFLSVTPLKTLDGIEFHFTVSTLYYTKNAPKQIDIGKTLTLLINKHIKLNEINYVAFDQKSSRATVEYDMNEMRIKLDSTGINKSNLVINPMLYASKRYAAKFIDDSGEIVDEIPVFFQAKISEIKNEFTKEQQKAEFEKLNVKDLYLVVYRYNPGRKRVVNKVFNEKISGQVQSFELRSLKSDYR